MNELIDPATGNFLPHLLPVEPGAMCTVHLVMAPVSRITSYNVCYTKLLRSVGDLVLLGQHLQQVGPCQGHEEAGGQLEADFPLEDVGLFFHLIDLTIDDGCLVPAIVGHRHEEGQQLLAALVHLGDVLLQGFDRGLGKESQNGSNWHNTHLCG